MEVHRTDMLLVLAFDNINADEQQHPKDRECKKNSVCFSEGRLAWLQVSFHPIISPALPDKKGDSDFISDTCTLLR